MLYRSDNCIQIYSAKNHLVFGLGSSFGGPQGSCRRDLLDHIVALNERHLKRLLSDYVRYHHEDRTHLGLEKGTPDGRIRSVASGQVLAQERLGGLHHRYDRAA
jgi:hypothetical protein